MELDGRDQKLIGLLQENGRAQLTALAKALNLSIDSTHKRLKRLIANKVIYIRAQVAPKTIGFDLIANVQIKLSNVSDEELNRFIAYLRSHPNVTELISILGDYDITCVFIAKNTEQLETIYREVRHKFKDLIVDWHSVINLKIHKFEEYALSELMKAAK
jgi:DNA-binding Lrp family transcriptional regulator